MDVHATDRLHRLALQVARMLARDHGIERAPAPDEYRYEAAAPGDEGTAFTFPVDLGRGLTFTVHADLRGEDGRCGGDEAVADRVANYISFLHGYAREVRAVRSLEVRRLAKVAEAGLPCRLISIENLQPDIDDRPAPGFAVEIEALDEALRPGRTVYHATAPILSRYHLDNLERDQALCLRARENLARHGATACIETVLLRALRQAGVADADLLGLLRRSADDDVTIAGADGREFRLRWANGCVGGRVELAAGVRWDGTALEFDHAPRSFDRRCVGRRLVDLYPHPLLSEHPTVTSARGRKGGHARLKCSATVEPFHLEEERFID